MEADIEQTLLARRDKRVVDREMQPLDGHLIATELHQATDESMAHELSAPERAHDATEGPRQARQRQRTARSPVVQRDPTSGPMRTRRSEGVVCRRLTDRA